jgi:hypothetical protein
MSDDFLSFYENTAPIFSPKEFGHEGIESAAESRFTCPPMPHHCHKGSLFDLPVEIPKGRSFGSVISERQVFDGDGNGHLFCR